MIPFVRILEYGNRAPSADKRVNDALQSHYGSVYYLHSDGNFYTLGSNSLGQGGTGNTNSTNAWTLVNSNVERYFGGVHGTIIIKKDKSIWYTGTRTALPMLSANTSGVWVDITQYFSTINVLADDIKSCHISAGIRILLNDGRWFYCGENTNGYLGTGNTTSVSTFTFSSISSVKEISGSFASTVLLLNDNTTQYAGAFVVAGGSDVSNTLTFTAGPTGVQGIGSTYYTAYFFMQDGTTLVSSTNSSGQAGSGGTTVAPMGTLIPFTTSGELKYKGSLTNSAGMSPIVFYNSKLWRCGVNSVGQCGNGRTQSSELVMVEMDLTSLGTNSVLSFCGDTNRTYILDTQYNMYVCGTTGISGVSGSNVPTILSTSRMPWK